MSARCPIVLLHGFLGCARDFDAVVEALPRRRECIALDLPGHGAQPRALAAAAGDFAGGLAEVRELIGAALRQRRAHRCHLVGYSMGGRLALALALAQADDGPRLAASVLAVGAHPGIADAAARRHRQRADAELAAQLRRDGLDAFLRAWYGQALFASLRATPAFAALLARRRQGDAALLAQALEVFGTGSQPSLHAALARAAVPVLLVAGEQDHKFAALNREMARACPTAALEIVPGAGHAVHLEQPTAFAALLRRLEE